MRSWYPENAYTTLLSDVLRENGVGVRTPQLPLWFPLTRTDLANRDADAMQLDWIYDYDVTSGTGFGSVNVLLSFLRAAVFLNDVALVSLLSVGIVRTIHHECHHEGLYPPTERVGKEWVFLLADTITVQCTAAAGTIAATYRVPEADELAVIPDGNFIEACENDLIEAFTELDAPDAELWIVGNPHDNRTEAQVTALARRDPRYETRLACIADERIQCFLIVADVLALPYCRILNSGTV